MGDVVDDSKTSQFSSITGADPATANFYLESCNGDLTMAIDRYLGDDASVPPAAEPERFLPPRPNVQAADESGSQGAAPGPVGKKPSGGSGRQPAPRGKSNIRGFSDLGTDEREESEEEEDNEYYAGGEKSGVAVKGGGKKEKVEGLFDSARKHGAVEGTEKDFSQANETTKAFTGSARTLAGGERPAEPQDVQNDPVAHTITFYGDEVFVVDDGEPREMADPANASFLNALKQGKCPQELEPADGRPVTVDLVRKETKYVPPEKPKYVAFSGEGQTLDAGGSSSGPTSGAGVVPGAAWQGPDEAQPTTSIQLRMHDGSRMVARFNHHHTILDIRRFIASARPDMPVNYSLLTAFPSAPLDDDSVTIEAAGLMNAVIIQKK